MLKNILLFFLSVLGAILFAAFFLYFFAYSVQMDCARQPDHTYTCAIEKKLFDKVLISRYTVTRVIGAHLVEDCDEGCSYRSELLTRDGSSQPFDDVYVDYEIAAGVTDKVNAFIKHNDGPGFSVTQDVQWWVVILIVGLALMGLGIELIAIFIGTYRWWVGRQQ